MATTGKESPEAKNPTPTPQLGEYGYNPFFADWLVGECQNLHRFGDFDENGAYFIQIDDLLDAYQKHPEIVKNGWDYQEIPAILKRWASHRMAWDGLDFLKKREKTADWKTAAPNKKFGVRGGLFFK